MTSLATYHAFFMKKFNEHRCVKCGYRFGNEVLDYCKEIGFNICPTCQIWYNKKEEKVSQLSKQFYLALLDAGVNVEIEKYDGHKTIDLVVAAQDLRFNIEIDGIQHYQDIEQSMADLNRTFHSLKKGFFTLRIPNVLVVEKLHESVEIVLKMLEHIRQKGRVV